MNPRWQRPLLWATVAVVLGAVFGAYLNPHLALDLTTRVWSCF
jgi:hypothetical protein